MGFQRRKQLLRISFAVRASFRFILGFLFVCLPRCGFLFCLRHLCLSRLCGLLRFFCLRLSDSCGFGLSFFGLGCFGFGFFSSSFLRFRFFRGSLLGVGRLFLL